MASPKLAATAVVLHNDKVLLVKRKNNPNAGLWGFPGGHVELGETALECAKRELLEETGVSATPLKYLTNIDLIQRDSDHAIQFHYLLAVVYCQYVTGEPLAADDALEAAWFSVAEVLENKAYLTENVRDITLLSMREQSIKT